MKTVVIGYCCGVFATIAAIIFGFALLLDLFNTDLGAPDALNPGTLTLAGLLFLALHFGGFGSGRRWYRRRRPGAR